MPTILLYDRPSSGLEGKFSMPFCAAAAVVRGRVGIETFDLATLSDAAILSLQARVTMRVDPTLDPSAPSLTQARVTVRLRDGRVLIGEQDHGDYTRLATWAAPAGEPYDKRRTG